MFEEPFKQIGKTSRKARQAIQGGEVNVRKRSDFSGWRGVRNTAFADGGAQRLSLPDQHEQSCHRRGSHPSEDASDIWP
ncbi:MAG: hypothetical protein DMG30_12875 [Acidobacteria bacterium]|nr:MAG: hypothetical protein DMG30_12875 [Acidobacteriota bacterium]